MVGFVFLTYRFLEPIAEFTEVLDQTQTAVAGMRRVLGVLEIPSARPNPRCPWSCPPGRWPSRLIGSTSATAAAATLMSPRFWSA